MVYTCRACARPNPAGAAYCYHDGIPLDDRAKGGPVNVGTQAFAHPFVLPSGLSCANFDQLVLAHQDHWPIFLELLREGYLQAFLGSMGRTDLAVAAREAARADDPERGLDEFLTRLPSAVLQPPQLHVEPSEINLGQLPVGKDHRFELTFDNQGMRLIHGSVTCANAPWLVLGDDPGVPQKHFQFHGELTLAVRVRGRYLRASPKVQTGRLVIESNAGSVTVPVRVEVPIKPFPEGALAGARSPRQVAEKARAHPREAAVLMESGAVARWYESNGWIYPVPGPPASGLGAVQQFFEALGLVTPPRVDVSEAAISLRGRPRARLEYVIDVSCRERRPVFAHATSDQPWLEVGRPLLEGRVAHIPLTVPTVPNHPGHILHGRVIVTANGNQRFIVPVALEVGGGVSSASVVGGWGGGVESNPPRREPYDVFAGLEDALEEGTPANWSADPPPARPVMAAVALDVPAAKPARTRPARTAAAIHVLPLALLIVSLLGLVTRDALLRPAAPAPVLAEELDPRPRIALSFHDRAEPVTLGESGMKPEDAEDRNHQDAVWEPSMRFGLLMLNDGKGGSPKRLTFDDQGRTNNACVRLDGHEWLFGERPFHTTSGRPLGRWPGRWQDRDLPLGNDSSGQVRLGRKSIWVYDDHHVAITQTVEIVRGGQSRLLDTCVVRYRIENHDRQPHRVGLRFLLDTFIGANDGVPFTIPGSAQLCDTTLDRRGAAVPDFIQALEREDLRDPGTIAHVQLRVGGPVEPPDRITLGAWPNPRLASMDSRCKQEKTLWEVPVLPIKSLTPADSAVTLYWDEREVISDTVRELGFAYGLGRVYAGEGGGRLALTAGGSFTPGGEFSLTALVRDPVPGETVTLTLPDDFTLTEGASSQAVPTVSAEAASHNSPVTWKVKASGQEGSYTLEVGSSTGARQSQPITIRAGRIFD